MLKRFEGAEGRQKRIDAFLDQKLVLGNAQLAQDLADCSDWMEVPVGENIIEQDAEENDVYFIIGGVFEVLVNGRRVAFRSAGDQVGEMAAIELAQRRAATIKASTLGLVAKVTESKFTELANKYPQMYRGIARELSRRLLQRNTLIAEHRKKARVFIISSAEALGVVREIQDAFSHDDIVIVPWHLGVFKACTFAMEALEAELDQADFAVAVASGEDIIETRDQKWPIIRDNVTLELGLFMGRLGRHRAILMEPRGEKVKVASDLLGITTIPYRYQKGDEASRLMGPACNELRKHFDKWGPNNG